MGRGRLLQTQHSGFSFLLVVHFMYSSLNNFDGFCASLAGKEAETGGEREKKVFLIFVVVVNFFADPEKKVSQRTKPDLCRSTQTPTAHREPRCVRGFQGVARPTQLMLQHFRPKKRVLPPEEHCAAPSFVSPQ